ncbi:FkbM family methyltransferase [Stappia sp. ES.058]|uniref:FkbM family methyltransferase n=1 Tax=Stappia sp. ES.058 TaxID=1881061 RepID=UPI0012FD81FA|nr:FkbM family methyltransferase [Stappia sp. ES.058]
MSTLPVPTRLLEPLIRVGRIKLGPLSSPKVRLERAGRFKIVIDDPSDHVQTYLHFQGHFERRETEIVRTTLQDGDVFVDIGANVGWFTMVAAETVGTRGRVISFEPFPGSFERLRRNIDVNGFDTVTAIPCALSDRDGKVPFFANTANSGRNSMFQDPDQVRVSEIEMRRGQDVLAQLDVEHINFCKIDVEGAELQVLRGLDRHLKDGRIDHILIEMNPEKLEQAGGSIDALFTLLRDSGFDIYDVANPQVALKNAPSKFFNAFCIHSKSG